MQLRRQLELGIYKNGRTVTQTYVAPPHRRAVTPGTVLL
eukprot:COSAG01_NODE_4849_length_4684_cov_12.227263_2_plen_39_part_00